MVKINKKDIHITRHPADGFTLSYISDNGGYYKQRYIFYSISEAKKRFMVYLRGVIK